MSNEFQYLNLFVLICWNLSTEDCVGRAMPHKPATRNCTDSRSRNQTTVRILFTAFDWKFISATRHRAHNRALYSSLWYVNCGFHVIACHACAMDSPLPSATLPLPSTRSKCTASFGWWMRMHSWTRFVQRKLVRSFALYAKKSTHFLMCAHIYRILIGLIDMDERRQSTQRKILQQCANENDGIACTTYRIGRLAWRCRNQMTRNRLNNKKIEFICNGIIALNANHNHNNNRNKLVNQFHKIVRLNDHRAAMAQSRVDLWFQFGSRDRI